jgi:outer membrane lipoprotein-sorting protein
MNKKIIMKVLLLFLGTAGVCWSCAGTNHLDIQKSEKDVNCVEVVLEQLHKRTKELQSYESQVRYKFSQPLLESQSLRKGVLYYAKSDGKSRLRINFQTLKQDDEKQQKYIEHYIFDGVWLTHIDYQIKAVKRYELAEPNKPVDAFDLVSRNLPIIGFSNVQDLKKEFEIEIAGSTSSPQAEQKPSVIPAKAGIQDFIQLHLKVRPDSVYKDDYTSIDFWIDEKLYLPAKVVAVSTEEDIYEIEFLKPKVNQKINQKVFELEIPEGFSVEIEKLKKRGSE